MNFITFPLHTFFLLVCLKQELIFYFIKPQP